ncbi:NAD-dependent epimerase/dehydratase family protein [Pedosphaera parvula]|uniref:NAD-dependent epimerase/dehydratase n=1 Tax=Pedosphaera parvula (strain Ellin514) TaxID=320771 RepID=B9XKS7_PEDPL|nr:NAD-dependent epimerase/dehydratase family protein [Pedosphaera parvula]EEF59570.1 NAD-dependent epimerase/dehydratase [Pedosphaera parvula Ellin514]
MRLIISGICGFVGSTIAAHLRENFSSIEVLGFDNFIRPGSELNRVNLKRMGVRVLHADVRSATDLEVLPPADWVIDAAANPSVLAGVDGQVSSRQLVEHNLVGTINLLEYCKARKAGFTLLSTSRVYSIAPLAEMKVMEVKKAYVPDPGAILPPGLSRKGVAETFSTTPPVSLYGSTKLASEHLALEYGETFGFPVWINRCGVLAGAGQFGRADQGIFSFWINSWLRRKPMKYIGFNGQGAQVRDCLHPRDIVSLVLKQMEAGKGAGKPRIANVSGGEASATSLAQLSDWCAARFGPHTVESDGRNRAFDIPWMVLDSTLAGKAWNWEPETKLEAILDEIARHAEAHPDWLELSAP